MHFASFLTACAAILYTVSAQTAVSRATFDNIVQYTRFARACYGARCQVPPNSSTVVQYFNGGDNGPRAILFQYDQAKRLVIAFRGTATLNDVAADGDFVLVTLNAAGTKCQSCQVHNGVQKYYNIIGPAVIASIKAAVRRTGYDVVITGHSLGGALAAVATASIGASGIKIAAVYTYGEPRNGNGEFGKYLLSFVPQNQYYRVTHSNDAVPSVPPSTIGFYHHGDEYWQANTGYNNTERSTYRCPFRFGIEPLNCNLAQRWDLDKPLNKAHISYSNGLIGNVLYIRDCGAGA